MINHKYKCIFVHIPRTSGTSIEFDMGVNMDKIGNKHLKASEIFNTVDESIWKSYFKFSIVRNPWDRIISLYHQPFFRSINNLSGKSLNHFLSCYKPAPHESGTLCLDYIDRDDLDFIGKFENRKNDVNFIYNTINLSNILNKNRRKSKHKHYTTYYDNETREIVAKKYAKDIEYFGYEFGE